MPRVPVLGIPETRASATGTVFQDTAGASPEAAALFGRNVAAAGRDLAAQASATGSLAVQMQREDNTRVAKDLDNALARQLRSITTGDGSAPGFFSMKGAVAVDAAPAVLEQLDQAAAQVREDYGQPLNARVESAFGLASDARVENTRARVISYLNEQRLVAADATSMARINEARDDAMAAWNDPRILERSIGIAEQEVLSQAERSGWSDEVAATKMQEATTVILEGVIGAAYQTNPGAALSIYNKNKARIDGRARPGLEKMMKEGTTKQRAQMEADRIWALFPNDPVSARKAAKAITNADVREQVLRMVRMDIADVRGDETFRRQMEAEARVGESQIAADEIRKTSASMPEALAYTRNNFTGKDRDAIERRLLADYEVDRRLAADNISQTASETAMEIARSSKNEAEALKTADDIIRDGRRRDEVKQQLRIIYSDERRADQVSLSERARQTTAEIQAEPDLTESEAIARTRDVADAELARATEENISRAFSVQDRDNRRRTAQASSEAFAAVWGGQTVADWAQQNPGQFQIIAGNSSVIGNLMLAEDRVAKGQIFARTTDGETLAAIQSLPIEERAQLDLAGVRASLTESEFAQASASVAAAQTKMRAAPEQQAIFNEAERVLLDFAPRVIRNGRATQQINLTDDQLQTAKAEMSDWVASRIANNEPITRPLMIAEAQRLMTSVEIPGVGIGGVTLVPFTGFEGIAAEIRNMTQEDRSQVRVNKADIPEGLWVEMEELFTSQGIEPSTSLLENFFGAVAAGDLPRQRDLLGMPR